jgi:hypothetical protein
MLNFEINMGFIPCVTAKDAFNVLLLSLLLLLLLLLTEAIYRRFHSNYWTFINLKNVKIIMFHLLLTDIWVGAINSYCLICLFPFSLFCSCFRSMTNISCSSKLSKIHYRVQAYIITYIKCLKIFTDLYLNERCMTLNM